MFVRALNSEEYCCPVFGLSLVCKEKELDISQFYKHLFS